MSWVTVGLVAILAIYGGHRLALWADERGWIFYKTKPKFRGSSLGLLESVYNPAMEHVVEERGGERSRGSQDESGDDADGADGAADNVAGR